MAPRRIVIGTPCRALRHLAQQGIQLAQTVGYQVGTRHIGIAYRLYLKAMAEADHPGYFVIIAARSLRASGST
ncbi:hypothetical protein DQP57_12025 [Mycobacterium colombiense]|uniref:Uncharacterized protein n=1 Tax=Mycobacterium colombiense TaxID=339268 RepID=A0A329LVN3_9MYCO|nr:hypothetical protein DQP57_12025 [Mycobacterium colombiense]